MANDTSYGTAEQLRDPHYMPPWGQAIPLGIQHILAMFISNVTPPLLFAARLVSVLVQIRPIFHK